MGFQFAETMAGTMELDATPGTQHPFSFEIRAHAASTREHLRDYLRVADLGHTLMTAPMGVRVTTNFALGSLLRPVR